MPSLFPSRWSSVQRVPKLAELLAPNDDDLALGWESACPALQLEGWEPAQNTPARIDPSLN